MTGGQLDTTRILAISLSTRGFGYAVVEGGSLVDWGVKSITNSKKTKTLKRAEDLMVTFTPTVLVLHDTQAKGSKRGKRATQSTKDLTLLARSNDIKLALLSHSNIREALCGNARSTKHEVAEEIAKRFPEELGSRLPPKRRSWDSESYSMGIFDAVSLALVWHYSQPDFRHGTPL